MKLHDQTTCPAIICSHRTNVIPEADCFKWRAQSYFRVHWRKVPRNALVFLLSIWEDPLHAALQYARHLFQLLFWNLNRDDKHINGFLPGNSFDELSVDGLGDIHDESNTSSLWAWVLQCWHLVLPWHLRGWPHSKCVIRFVTRLIHLKH